MGRIPTGSAEAEKFIKDHGWWVVGLLILIAVTITLYITQIF